MKYNSSGSNCSFSLMFIYSFVCLFDILILSLSLSKILTNGHDEKKKKKKKKLHWSKFPYNKHRKLYDLKKHT